MLTPFLIIVLTLVAMLVAPFVIFYGLRIVRRFGYGKCRNEQRT
jgi:hypothetical protein